MPPLFFLKLKHFIKRDKKLYCEAIGNYLGDGKFAFFFDCDNISLEDYLRILPDVSDEYYGIFKTKHGYQLIIYFPFSLKECRILFEAFKRRLRTDYFWSIPLWLRISPKWNEYGEKISDEPKLVKGTDKRKLFKQRKLYKTWD